MGKYEYNITKSVQQRIYSFYTNVAKKYPNTYDVANLLRDVESAYNAIYQIENGLLRREPSIARWKGKGFMANTKTWYYLYKIDGATINVIDACHSQNMRESYINYRIGALLKEHLSKRIIINESKRPVVRLTESELHKIVATISREILNEEYKVTSTDEDFKFENGVDAHSVLTLKDEAGGLTRVIEDDGCYVPYQRCVDGHYEEISYLYPELFNAMKKHLPNLPQR